MATIEVVNATVEAADVKISRGFALDVWLFFDYGDGRHQGYGGWMLAHVDKPKESGPLAAMVLVGLMGVFGVEDFSDIKGKPCRVRRESGLNGRVVGVGHFVKDKWFSFQETCDAALE